MTTIQQAADEGAGVLSARVPAAPPPMTRPPRDVGLRGRDGGRVAPPGTTSAAPARFPR